MFEVIGNDSVEHDAGQTATKIKHGQSERGKRQDNTRRTTQKCSYSCCSASLRTLKSPKKTISVFMSLMLLAHSQSTIISLYKSAYTIYFLRLRIVTREMKLTAVNAGSVQCRKQQPNISFSFLSSQQDSHGYSTEKERKSKWNLFKTVVKIVVTRLSAQSVTIVVTLSFHNDRTALTLPWSVWRKKWQRHKENGQKSRSKNVNKNVIRLKWNIQHLRNITWQ